MKSKRETAWKISNENRLQIFPKGSRQTYLTRPTKILPREALASAGVSVPPRRYADVLSKFGIAAAARASYSKYYYISRGAKTAFNTVCFFISTSAYRAKFEGEGFRVSSGDVLFIPAKTPCDTSASRAETLWFEMPDTPFWRGVFGSSPVCKKAAILERLLLLADMYSEELYSERPKVSRLVSLGGLIAGLLRSEFGGAEFGDAEFGDDAIARLVEKIDSDISADWTLEKACAFAHMGKFKLNGAFEERFGGTFSKYLLSLRMERAAALLESRATLDEIAREVGFSNGHALSFAFKKYYGFPPSECV